MSGICAPDPPGGHEVGVLVAVGAGVVPRLGQEQPPIQRARRLIGDRMDRDADLHVPDLPQRSRVLPRHARRSRPVLDESGVVDNPRLRPDQRHRLAGELAADRLDRPRRRGHKLLQLLIIDPEPVAHRLHRLPPPLQHQAPQIQTALRSLILPRQRREHLADELVQLGPHPLDLIRSHAGRLTVVTTINKDLTKYY